jgi:hypothetical protein
MWKKERLNAWLTEKLKHWDKMLSSHMREELDDNPQNFPTLWQGNIYVWEGGDWAIALDSTTGDLPHGPR